MSHPDRDEKTTQFSTPGTANSAGEKTPWSHDAQRYANLVNLAGNLTTFGWILFVVTLMVGLAFIFVGAAAELHHEQVLGISVGLAFILVGSVIKIVWRVAGEAINLFINIADDLHELLKK